MEKISVIKTCFMLLTILLASCSTDRMINEEVGDSASGLVEFSDHENSILGKISKPNMIGLDVAMDNVKSLNRINATRSEDNDIQEVGVLTKNMLGSIPDSISTVLPDTLAYVLYSESNGIFTIASADNRVESSVLAIIENGNILIDEDSEERQTILDTLVDYIYWGIRNYESEKESVMQDILQKINSTSIVAATRAQDNQGYTEDDLLIIDYEVGDWYLTDHVNEMLKVDWGYDEPYNEYVKYKAGCSNAPTGCVATAVAMIASYWRYPKSVGGMTLNWDLMTSTRSVPLQVNHLSDMAKQVAKLMQVIGEESNMNYGCDESGTDIVNGKNWLINHGYTGGNETGYNFSTAISSLKNGSPILMGGFDTKHSSIFSTSYSGGHAWVVDGYAVNERKRRRQVFVKKDKKTGQQVLLTDNYYTEKYRSLHNNWGFDGVYNGWFPEGCFDIHSKSRTQNITRSGVEGNYQYKNSMFVNLKHVN